jgi:leucyl aminopeptidase (aminopeptidase T)
MRRSDPFPLPEHDWQQPTHRLDWPAMATKLVRQVLKLERHERVLLSADPYCGGAMLDAVRQEIQRAGAIELATILHWTPALTRLRTADGNKSDHDEREAEERAMCGLFAAADVFIWLQNDWRSARLTQASGQSELVLERWPGRSVHFHWFHDPRNPDPDDPANKELDLVYQRAVLELDYVRLAGTMRRLATKMSDRTIRVADPAGTDISFRLHTPFCLNDGDASRATLAGKRTPREREEEIPCGALRALPVIDSVEGVLAFDGDFGYPAIGKGLDLTPFIAAGLRIYFRGGRVVRLETRGDQRALDALWAMETGDKDRLGEFVLGCNPLLQPVPGSGFLPYCGFGEAFLRLTIGENRESGGPNRSTLHRWLMFRNANICADDDLLVEHGKLTAANRDDG